MDYSSIVWDPYLLKDINALEKVQKRAARYISNNYSDRTPGSMTRILEDLDFISLQDRRKNLRLAFLYKLTNNQIPAMPPQDFITSYHLEQRERPQRNIKAKEFPDYEYENIVQKRTIKNDIPLSIPDSTCTQFRESYFVRTIIDWNQLENNVVHANSLEAFKSALAKRN